MKRHIFIGHDDREQGAYDVCVSSIKRRSHQDIEIHPLKHRDLRASGLFRREWKIDASGQYFDLADEKPFSTQFSHSRFLVPELCRRNRIADWVLFVDCDFLFLHDIGYLFELADPAKAVMCVQHEYRPSLESKMDGVQQSAYPRKNWSSLMLFNMAHPAMEPALDPDYVNDATGSDLHQFKWIDDKLIGALPKDWNYLIGETVLGASSFAPKKALHYTNGGPWIDGWKGDKDTYYDRIWLEEQRYLGMVSHAA